MGNLQVMWCLCHKSTDGLWRVEHIFGQILFSVLVRCLRILNVNCFETAKAVVLLSARALIR